MSPRPITPQPAWRVAVLGAIGFVLFAVVFFRRWYLQVLSGGRFVAVANANRVRDVPIPAPRGDIVDRAGVDLVQTKRAAVVQIVPSSLPQAVHDQAEAYREALAAAGRERAGAQRREDAFRRRLRDDGFGAATAAPAAREILAKWFGVPDHAFHAGSSTTL